MSESKPVFDADAYKRTQHDQWKGVTAAWYRYGPTLQNWFGGLTQKMLDLTEVDPDQRVLDIATGAGVPTLSAARRVDPQGDVLATDLSENILPFAQKFTADRGFPSIRVLTRNHFTKRRRTMHILPSGTRNVRYLATHMRLSAILFAAILVLWLTIFPQSADAIDEKWKSEMIADALLAAPPSVTHNATIYAWNAEGDMIAVRHGSGRYSCVASGFSSLWLGKPPLPYPDPMCMDQNAWAFFQAIWAEKNPMKPEKPYPTAPGLVWMLAGMSIKKGAVAIGKSETSVVKATTGQAGGEMFQMTPHVMIMPVPFNKDIATMPTSYSLDSPLNAWIMAAGTPIEHLMIHFSDDDVKGMMEADK